MLRATNLKSQIGEVAFIKLTDFNWLYEQYVIKNRTTRDIAREIQCGKKAVTTAIHRFNIKVNYDERNLKIKSIRGFNQLINPKAVDKINNYEWLYDQFLTQNKTKIQIAEELGITDHCVLSWLHRFKLQKSLDMALLSSRIRYKAKYGYEIDSVEACKKRMSGRKVVKIQTIKAGEITCHSTWEVGVAILLDKSEKVVKFFKDDVTIPYFFEKKRMLFLDFKILLNNRKTLLIEVKAEKLLKEGRTIAKMQALQQYASFNNYDYLIVTGKHKVVLDNLIRYLESI